MNFIKVLIGLVIIPIISYFSFNYITGDIDKKIRTSLYNAYKDSKDVDLNYIQQITYDEFCNNLKPEAKKDYQTHCFNYSNMKLAKNSSVVLFFGLIGLLIFIKLIGLISRKNRLLLLGSFRIGLIITQVSSVLIICSSAILLIALIYYGESYAIGRIHFGIIIVAGIITVGSTFKILTHIFKSFQKAHSVENGLLATKEKFPKLWNEITNICSQTRAGKPDNIIIGTTPNFYVTQAGISLFHDEGVSKLDGKTLYVSLPLCKLFNIDEFRAVIGHEMGHFVGNDTKYSLHFYPIYRGSINTVSELNYQIQATESLAVVTLLPAFFIMNYFLSSFEVAETEISRIRELEADSFSAKVFGNNSLANSLTKLHLFINYWNVIENKAVEVLQEGKYIENISQYFYDVCKNIKDESNQKEIVSVIEESKLTHPTDTHPNLHDRLSNLSTTVNDIYSSSLNIENTELCNQLGFDDETEKLSTNIENNWLVRRYNIQISDDNN